MQMILLETARPPMLVLVLFSVGLCFFVSEQMFLRNITTYSLGRDNAGAGLYTILVNPSAFKEASLLFRYFYRHYSWQMLRKLV